MITFKQYLLEERRTYILYHSSPVPLTKIDKYGTFGSFLFFSDELDRGLGESNYFYQIELDDDEIISAKSFFYRNDYKKLDSIIHDIMHEFSVDEDSAQELLSQEKNIFDIPNANLDSEAGWKLQYYAGQAATKLGYICVSVPDEYGTSWISVLVLFWLLRCCVSIF